MVDWKDPGAFEQLILRAHARRVAVIMHKLGRPIPAGVATLLESDTGEQLRADNDAYLDWCRHHGVEAMVHADDSYPLWDGEPLPYVEAVPEAAATLQ